MILIYKMLLHIILIIIVCVIPNVCLIAMTTDVQQSIKIKSIQQSLNLKNNIIVFTNKVILKQGSFNINADKIIIMNSNNINKMIIFAYAKPIKFYQLQNNNKIIQGYSNEMSYKVDKKIFTFIDHACLKQLNNYIMGDKIIYSSKTKQLYASSKKGKYVTTILSDFTLIK